MDRIRVLTLNIWNRQGPWEERLPLIQKGIAALEPDIIGLQEVIFNEGRSQADDIADALPGKYERAFGVAHDVGGGVHFGNAVLSRWPIARSAPYPLPTGFSDETRCVFFAEIASPFGSIPFFVTHLNWKFHESHVREAQVMSIAEQVRKESPLEGLPPILVGDFNAQPEASEIRFLKGLQSLQGKSFFLADAYEQTGAGPGYTFDATANPFAALTHEYPRRLDYIFVRGPDRQVRGKPLLSKVVLNEVENGVAPSDHWGVYAELSISPLVPATRM